MNLAEEPVSKRALGVTFHLIQGISDFLRLSDTSWWSWGIGLKKRWFVWKSVCMEWLHLKVLSPSWFCQEIKQNLSAPTSTQKEKKGALIYGELRKNYWSQVSDLVEDKNEGIKCRSEYGMAGGPYLAHSRAWPPGTGAQTGKGGLFLKKLKPQRTKLQRLTSRCHFKLK